MGSSGFCNALGLKASIEALPIGQPRFFLVDEHCAAGVRKKIFEVSGRGKIDLVVLIQSCKNNDQLMFEQQFDGQADIWYPELVHDHLHLEPSGIYSPVFSHVHDEGNSHFGIVINMERYFSETYEVWLDNLDLANEHVLEWLLVLYSKFPAV